MYLVSAYFAGPFRQTVEWTKELKQEDLDKTIGRYTRKYGPPINISEHNDSEITLEFYKKEKNGCLEAKIKYVQVEEKKSDIRITKLPDPPKEETKLVDQPTAIQMLYDDGLIEKETTYSSKRFGNRWDHWD